VKEKRSSDLAHLLAAVDRMRDKFPAAGVNWNRSLPLFSGGLYEKGQVF
jgi:hypothetical protein